RVPLRLPVAIVAMNHGAFRQSVQMLVQVVIRTDLTDETGQVSHCDVVALYEPAIDRWVMAGGRIETHPGACDCGWSHPILVGCGAEKRGLVGIADVVNLPQIDAKLKCVAALLFGEIVHEVQDRNLAIDAGGKGVDVSNKAKNHMVLGLEAPVIEGLTHVTKAEAIDPRILESGSESSGQTLAGDHFHYRIRLSGELLRASIVVISILHASHKQAMVAIGGEVVI